MKVFIQSVLYLNVGLGSLFFVIWALTSLPFFQPFAQAEEAVKTAPVVSPAPQGNSTRDRKGTALSSGNLNVEAAKKNLPIDEQKEGQVTSPVVPVSEGKGSPLMSGDAAQPSSPSVINNKGTTSSLDEKRESVQRESASVPDSSSVPPPPTVGETAVPPPPNAVNNNIGQTQPSEKKADNASGGNESAAEEHSASLNKLLESAKNFQREKGASADAANDLMDINQRVVEIYKMLSNYHYDSDERRDPFVPFKEEGLEDSELAIPTYPTGQYDLSEIKLKGIKWNSRAGPSKALFETPDKVIHYLQKNDWIGRNRGIVYQLKEDEVVIVEPRLKGAANKQEDSYVPIIVRLDRLTDKKGK